MVDLVKLLDLNMIHLVSPDFHRLLDILEACLWQQGWCDTETYCLLFKQKPSILLKIGKFVRPDS